MSLAQTCSLGASLSHGLSGNDHSMRVAIIGASGFVGGAILESASAAGHVVVPVSGLRVRCAAAYAADVAASQWLDLNESIAAPIIAALADTDVVVNAAGFAAPHSTDWETLFSSNSVLPAVVGALAAQAGVSRLIHISTAAVQGRRDPLDETATTQPFSAYSRSKAFGEHALQSSELLRPGMVTIYRPTSVQGVNRPTTRALVRFASRRFVPIAGAGNARVPVCTTSSLASAVIHLISRRASPPIVLQPWEGMTTRSLLEALGRDPTFIPIPETGVRWVVSRAAAVGDALGRAGDAARRLEVLALGQGQQACELAEVGFEPRDQSDVYRAIGMAVREIHR